MQRELAIITGASSGLGAEFARELFKSYPQFDLLLIARREERLKALAREFSGREVHLLPLDLVGSSAPETIASFAAQLGLPVGLLINNAGFGSLASFSRLPLERETSMVQLNCLAPLKLTHLMLPLILNSETRTILNVCSTAAYQPMPFMATYGATKAFLRNWSLALASELSAQGVRVVTHCPGPTDTEFHHVVGLPKKLAFLPAASAQRVVADTLKRALVDGDKLIVNGLLNRSLSALAALLPLRLGAAIVALILRRFR